MRRGTLAGDGRDNVSQVVGEAEESDHLDISYQEKHTGVLPSSEV
jgi:hypothetical protein